MNLIKILMHSIIPYLKTTPLTLQKKEKNYKFFLKKLEYLQKIHDEISRMKHGSIAYVNQITTISKQRIFKTPILSGIKLSSNSLDLLDEKVKKLFTK